ncbi:tRNA pseudouridine(38-40) synthase TruA [Candidatus Aminicenantes bacterium AH-873-B07]|jgi:tRNA pseudouridine38-40 synthase|nr:tRNA pseudouridine(38-40) synthase TruA [Candidatus Aminicenantes bacterium AH-873-B07]
MNNYKIIIAYDGINYHGWQIQPGIRTIQGTIQEALEKITEQKIKIIGAGRTDAGVHAKGQVANFWANINLKEEELFRALNAVLPRDIRIISLEKVPLDFHARKKAKAKIYEYRILNSQMISPFLFRYVFHYPYPLNFNKMKEASKYFVGKKDFTLFSSGEKKNNIREVYYSEVFKREDEIIYKIKANSFIRYMVRKIVGILIEVGKRKFEPEIINDIFENKNHSITIPTAPPHGLCLLEVIY